MTERHPSWNPLRQWIRQMSRSPSTTLSEARARQLETRRAHAVRQYAAARRKRALRAVAS